MFQIVFAKFVSSPPKHFFFKIDFPGAKVIAAFTRFEFLPIYARLSILFGIAPMYTYIGYYIMSLSSATYHDILNSSLVVVGQKGNFVELHRIYSMFLHSDYFHF